MLKIVKNTLLATKDGRKIGNAIIFNIEGEVYHAVTDYGNVLRLLKSEIDEWYHIGEVSTSDHKYFDYKNHGKMVNSYKLVARHPVTQRQNRKWIYLTKKSFERYHKDIVKRYTNNSHISFDVEVWQMNEANKYVLINTYLHITKEQNK